MLKKWGKSYLKLEIIQPYLLVLLLKNNNNKVNLFLSLIVIIALFNAVNSTSYVIKKKKQLAPYEN